MDLNEITALVGNDFQDVNHLIRERLASNVVLINQLAQHIVASGGKRLRPLTVLLSARASSYAGRAHINLAAVIEFIHTATLLHDDVVDGSERRRGRQTANSLWGNSASVLVGDFLYSRAFQMMVEVDRMAVMSVLADATNAVAEGEVLQLLNCHDPETDEARYFEVIERKTARLFEAAARLGAVLANLPEDSQISLGHYGQKLGIAYQLIDDVLDLSADPDKTGKNLGADLAEGKPTLPVIYAAAHASNKAATHIRKAIEQGGTHALGPVMVAIHETGALDYVRRLAKAYIDEALEALECLPHGKYRDGLRALAEFAVSRVY